MKTLFYALFLLMVCMGVKTHAQATWTQQNIKPGNFTYYDLHMVNDQIGVARTNKNLIAITQNGGANWSLTKFQPDVTKASQHMVFPSPFVGYIAVKEGSVYKTTDGGLNWTNTGAGFNLMYLHFESDLVGYGLENSNQGVEPMRYFKTTNGGQSWQQTGEVPAGQEAFVHFTSRVPGELWATYSKINQTFSANRLRLYKSTNGGQTWAPLPFTAPKQVRRIHWFDELHGWTALDSNVVGRTVDGGITWAYHTLPNFGNNWPWKFNFPTDPQHGFLLTEEGYVFKTEDGGVGWTYLVTPSSGRIFDLDFINNQTGWVAGGFGLLAKSTNSGNSWTYQVKGRIDNIHDVCFQGTTRAWVVGDNRLTLVSNDKGISWDHVEIDTALFNTYRDIHFVSPMVGFAAHTYGISKTTDGGLSWARKTQWWSQGTNISKLFFLSPSLGWATGEFGNLIKTTDGGETWSVLFEDGDRRNNRIQFLNPDVGFWIYQDLSGLKVMKTTTGGAQWTSIGGDFPNGKGFHFFNENQGIVSQFNQPMLTSDGGATWQPSATFCTLYQLKFLDNQVGYGIGPGGIFKTTNGGITWNIETSFPLAEYQFTSMDMVGEVPLLVAGEGGTIYSRDDWTDAGAYIATGKVLNDQNFDCIQDSNEFGLAQRILLAEPGPHFATTDVSGTFNMRLDQGQFSIRQILKSTQTTQLEVQICPPNQNSINLSVNGLLDTLKGNDFINRIKQCPVLTLDLAQPFSRPCRRGTLQVLVKNEGNSPSDTEYVHIRFPLHLHLISANAIFDYYATDSTYRFKIKPLMPNETFSISIIDSTSCLPNLISGETYCIKGYIPDPPPCLLQSPLWDGADLEVASRCLTSGQTRFFIRNSGLAMNQTGQYRIYIDSALVYQAAFQLAANNSMSVTLPTNAPVGFVRLVVPQSTHHPLSTFASAEANCATGLSTNGLFPPPDQSPLVDIECVLVTNSFDPNDKLVFPTGWGTAGNVEPETEFKYTIRFQNTGTDTAFKVVLIDTLDQNLDIASLQIGNASHNYAFKVSGRGRPILTWTFNNILLPDSGRNQEASNGFVSFSIRPKATAPVGTRLENFADIYFDFNDPIRTNTTVNTIWVPTLDPGVLDTVFVTEVKKVITERDLSIYPNPTKGKVNILTTSPATAYVFNSNGVLVIRRNLETSTNEIDLTSLSKGLYLIRLDAENGKQQTKIVLE
jgi:uncharacterized repeat protein (TIGR01451 family)